MPIFCNTFIYDSVHYTNHNLFMMCIFQADRTQWLMPVGHHNAS